MTIHPSDHDWLEVAARLGLRGRPASRPNPSVGALVIKDGRILGRGVTQQGGRPHGEAAALSQAGEDAHGATLYATLEPCAHQSARGPSCSDLIAQAGIVRVVFSLTDPDPRTSGKGAGRLRDAGVSVVRLDSEAAHRSLRGYLTQRVKNRPFVTLKLALSLDGLLALPSGESQWITGEAARAHVHSRRALSDAILVGSGTWREDQPRLNVRLPGLEQRSPDRYVLTRSNHVDGANVLNAPEAICELADIQYLYVEGGAETAASFLRADLVDQIDLYRAPILIGSGKSAIGDLGIGNLADAHGRWKMIEHRMLGSDTYEAYERQP